MPDKRAPEYKEADRRTGPNQVSTPRARAGVTGHNVRYVLGFGLIAVTTGLLTRDETRGIATNIAKLPELERPQYARDTSRPVVC